MDSTTITAFVLFVMLAAMFIGIVRIEKGTWL